MYHFRRTKAAKKEARLSKKAGLLETAHASERELASIRN
jgi:hypothetical protein